MNNPDYISESLETIFWVQILKFFDVDSESGMEKFESVIRDLKWKKLGSGIRDKHPGSATLFEWKPPELITVKSLKCIL